MMAEGRIEPIDQASAIDAILRMGEEDLRALNYLIVERLKLIAQARSTVTLARFKAGHRVSFQVSTGQRKVGIVLRLNKRTASIATDDGQQWNVHPGFLTAVGRGDIQ